MLLNEVKKYFLLIKHKKIKNKKKLKNKKIS